METQRPSPEPTSGLRVAITGSHGLVGSALSSALRAAGEDVVANDRSKPVVLDGVDAVVNLAGEPIAAKRWSTEQKRKIVDSRVDITTRVAEAVARDGVPILLSGSAIGFYGDRGEEELTESSPAGTGFLTDVVEAWEAAAAPAVAAGARVVFLRTGIVQSADGGALKKQLPLFKLGLGGRMGSGRQWLSWISIDDEVGAIRHLLRNDVRGPVNLTAPNPVRQGAYAKTLAGVLHRPSFLPTPSFGPKLLLGSELAETLLDDSQRVLPAALESSGFTFEHPALEGALRSLLR
jgi:uncharacterized protein (TIGR01777 family)